MNIFSRALRRLFGRSDGQGGAEIESQTAGQGLRLRMLTTLPSAYGATPSGDFPRVYGVLFDWPISYGVATIVSTVSGDASLYTSGSFGIVGGVGHAPVRESSVRLIREAESFHDSAAPVSDYPYPGDGKVRFYFVCYDGVRTIEASERDVIQETHPLHSLWSLAQDVLTQLRLTVTA